MLPPRATIVHITSIDISHHSQPTFVNENVLNFCSEQAGRWTHSGQKETKFSGT